MADQGTSSGHRHSQSRSKRKTSPLRQWLKSLFPSPEERWEKKKHRRKRRNPIKEAYRKFKERRAYKRYQKKEQRKSRRHSKAFSRQEQKDRIKNLAIIQFFKKNFKKETKPYYYYAETDQPKSEIQRQRKRLLHFFVNSTVLYLIAYFAVYITYQATVMFVASRFGLNSVFYFFEVAFPAGNNSSLWSSFNIILITFSGPFISVMLGVYYLMIKARSKELKGLMKLFYLWLAYHSLNYFLGGFVAGVITKQGFGYVIEWLYLPTFIRFGGSIIALFGMGVIGFFQSKIFFESSNSIYWTQRSQRPILVLFGAVLPWALSVFFLFVLKFPYVIPQHENIVQWDSIMYVTMIFFIGPMLVNYIAKPEFDATVRKAKGRRINYLYITILIIIIVAFRAGLDTGFSYFVFK